MNVAAPPPPPHHTITTTTTTLLALAWHAINPASPSHEPLARKGEKKKKLRPLLENAYKAVDVSAITFNELSFMENPHSNMGPL